MDRKLLFYHNYGVEEYYLYDPYGIELDGWCWSEDGWLDRIESMAGWVSPRLGIRFELGEELEIRCRLKPSPCTSLRTGNLWNRDRHQFQLPDPIPSPSRRLGQR
jgi:hypothetical protein